MKIGVGIAIGAVAGGGIGSFLTYIFTARKFNREKEDELDEVRAYYRQKLKEKEANQVENVQKEAEIEAKSVENKQDKPEKLSQKVGLAERNTVDIGREKIIAADTDYTKFAKISADYRPKDGGEMFQFPHEINEDEYDNDPDYSKQILTWYENDDILADVNDRISDYKVEDFGYENLADFGAECVKYLRNEKTMTDFKIIYEGTISYDEATGGVNLNDP